MRWIVVIVGLAFLNFAPAVGLGQDGVPENPPYAPSVSLCPSDCPCGRCFVAETDNFRIQCCTSSDRVREIGELCEQLRTRLQRLWIPNSNGHWQPRCEVVVHSSFASYCLELGPSSEQTSGCATIQLDQGKVVRRRIDLRSDSTTCITDSLPHELTHVVLADRFSTKRIPAWADEGIAMLSESSGKLRIRMEELQSVMADGRTIQLRELVTMTNGPSPRIRDAFYGQSVTFAAMLLDRGTPEQLLQFVESGEQQGYDHALHDVYGLQSWTSIEQDWRSHAGTRQLLQRRDESERLVNASEKSAEPTDLTSATEDPAI